VVEHSCKSASTAVIPVLDILAPDPNHKPSFKAVLKLPYTVVYMV